MSENLFKAITGSVLFRCLSLYNGQGTGDFSLPSEGKEKSPNVCSLRGNKRFRNKARGCLDIN